MALNRSAGMALFCAVIVDFSRSADIIFALEEAENGSFDGFRGQNGATMALISAYRSHFARSAFILPPSVSPLLPQAPCAVHAFQARLCVSPHGLRARSAL